jgi:hypothetical protein
MQKLIIVILVILTSYCSSKAQTLKAISQSGYEESYLVSNNLKITFDSTAFVFSKGGTILKKWGYGEVSKIVYVEGSTRIDENIPSVQSYKVSVYPQPSKEQISISYHVPEQSPIHIKMYGVDGAFMFSYDVGVLQQGYNTSTITIPFSIPSGSYIMCIQGNTFSYNIPIIHSAGQ